MIHFELREQLNVILSSLWTGWLRIWTLKSGFLGSSLSSVIYYYGNFKRLINLSVSVSSFVSIRIN